MNGTIYKNSSPDNYINKTLSDAQAVTLHFKDDSSVQDPTIYISTDYDMRDYNYINIPDMHRYYYIEDVTLSQQRYICKCRSDVLMSFKSRFLDKKILLERSSNKYFKDLEDERAKAYQFIHIDTYAFEDGFDAHKQEFLLSVVGNPNVNASVTPPESGQKPENNGGSGKQHNVMSQEDYDNQTPEENQGTVIAIPNAAPAETTWNASTMYVYLTESKYNSLTQAEQENGTFYYISDKGNNTYGTRNIECSSNAYNSLTNKSKYNSTPYFVR